MPKLYDKVIVISLLKATSLAEYRTKSRRLSEFVDMGLHGRTEWEVYEHTSVPKHGSVPPIGASTSLPSTIPYVEICFKNRAQVAEATQQGIKWLSKLTPKSKLIILGHGDRGSPFFMFDSLGGKTIESVYVTEIANLIRASFRLYSITPKFSRDSPLQISLFSCMAADWGETGAPSQSLAGRLVESLAWSTPLKAFSESAPYIYAQVTAPWTATTGQFRMGTEHLQRLHLPRGVSFRGANFIANSGTINAEMQRVGLDLCPAEGAGSKLTFSLDANNQLVACDPHYPTLSPGELSEINQKKDIICNAFVQIMMSPTNASAGDLLTACAAARTLIANSTSLAELTEMVSLTTQQNPHLTSLLTGDNLSILNKALRQTAYPELPGDPAQGVRSQLTDLTQPPHS